MTEFKPSVERKGMRGPILFVIGSARVGGAESQMTRLACELKGRGEDVRMLLLVFGGPLTEQLDAAGVPWEVMRRHDWPPSSTLRNLHALSRLAWRIARLRPRVVCAWLAGAVWPALLFARLFTDAVRIAGFRGEVFDRDLRWQAPLFRSAVRRAHLVTVNSPSLRSEAERWGASPERVRFIPNGVDIPVERADVVVSPPRAIVVANFRWYKGHDVLLGALALIDTRLEVRLCGEGAGKAELAAQVAEMGLGTTVTFVEEPADVHRELSQAQFAIHPSRTEGLSNAILEEMSHGLPVVATDVGGTSLLIEHGENGFLVNPGSSPKLAQAIDEMASNSLTRQQMSIATQLRVQAFDWDSCTDQYQAMMTVSAPRIWVRGG